MISGFVEFKRSYKVWLQRVAVLDSKVDFPDYPTQRKAYPFLLGSRFPDLRISIRLPGERKHCCCH